MKSNIKVRLVIRRFSFLFAGSNEKESLTGIKKVRLNKPDLKI
jgi:hypothetical protein